MRARIYIERQEDRSVVSEILVRCGYTVRSGKEKSKQTNKVVHFIEFWTEVQE